MTTQHQTRPTLYPVDAYVPKTTGEKASAFFGTTLGTVLGVLAFLALFALAGTLEFNALIGQ